MGESGPVRYTALDEDSGRWIGFPFRDGDIVISTRSKSGTTWMQMICALLVFKTPQLPAPIAELSPWFDWLVEPRDQVIARLEAQQHRRFLKTHTPLDGVVLDPRATYVVVARHPLDAAVSLYHHVRNLDRGRLHELIGVPAAEHAVPRLAGGSLREYLLAWIENETPAAENLDRFLGFYHHANDAWRRRHDPNVVLVHYADLTADLEGTMRALADRLGESVPEAVWPELVHAASFESMRARADELVPANNGVIKDATAFFRAAAARATDGVLEDHEVRRFEERAATLAPPDLIAWLHRA